MRDRPIILNGDMVRAILDGRKMQTRRAIKPQPELGRPWKNWTVDPEGIDLPIAQCPYGIRGDRLWVRETWRIGAWSVDIENCMCIDFRADGHCDPVWREVNDDEMFERLWTQSSDDAMKSGLEGEHFHWEKGEAPTRWRPSIFMPRWASRILLEITNVRIERVQDITESDAVAEGLNSGKDGEFHHTTDAFEVLWNSINKKCGLGWDVDPFVWVIDFEVIKQ